MLRLEGIRDGLSGSFQNSQPTNQRQLIADPELREFPSSLGSLINPDEYLNPSDHRSLCKIADTSKVANCTKPSRW